MEELEEELLNAIFDKSMSFEELEELFFSLQGDEEGEEVDFLQTWLEQENLSYEKAIEQKNNSRNRLLELGKQFDLPLEDSFQTCKKLSELEAFSVDLEEFLALFLSEQGTLLKADRELEEKEVLKEYALNDSDYQKTKYLLSTLTSLQQNWNTTKSMIFSKVGSDMPSTNVKKEELLKIHASLFPTTESSDIFEYNLEVMLGEINGLEAYRRLAPLYVYQVIINHSSRLQKNRDMVINPKSLWSEKTYEIYKDNGRNFNKNRQYLQFFERLCTLFQKDSWVNIPLCRWGFMVLSNLVEFHRSELEDKLESVFPYLDKILDVSFFSCFGYREKEAVMLKETEYTLKQVTFFQTSSDYATSLEKISLYMNQNALDILETVESYQPEKIKELCTDILLNSKLKKEERPTTQRELDLFLCAINLGILDLIDYFAKEYLVLGFIHLFRKECQ